MEYGECFKDVKEIMILDARSLFTFESRYGPFENHDF